MKRRQFGLLLFGVAVLVLLLYARTIAYEFFDPKSNLKEFKRKWKNLVLLNTGEKFLIDRDGERVLLVVFLLNKRYEKVRDEIRSIVAGSIGIETEGESITDEFVGDINSWMAEVSRPAERDVKTLKEMGIKIDKITRYKIVSRHYNRVEKVNGSSFATLKVLAGRDIFRKECTLLLLTRIDRWRDWGREFHTGIPVPWKVNKEDEYITNTEINLIEDLRVRESICAVKVFYPKFHLSPLMDVDMMKSLKNEVNKY